MKKNKGTPKNYNILIVGGAGYIGSHMLLNLVACGYSVVVFDNLSTGHSDAVANSKLHVGDVRNIEDLESCFKENDIDLVMHFAAKAYVGESVVKPEDYYENNVLGTINLIKIMRRYSVNKLVFSSSCATYGVPKSLPIMEKDEQSPINPYGYTKLIIERILIDYAKAYDFKSISLRYFNAAGCDSEMRAGERHDPETHIIPLILGEALRLKKGGDPSETKLKIFGIEHDTRDGSCIRDYIHVEDLCSAHLLAADRLFNLVEDSSAEFYNLCNGNGFSVLDLVASCRKITKMPIEVIVMPSRPGDPECLIGDSTLAMNTLGWHAKYNDIDSIISTAWRWMLSRS